MPRYEITSPDGQRYEVNAPEGVTEEQALSRLQTHLKIESDPISRGARNVPTPEETIMGSGPMRFALGAASPFIGGAQLGANLLGAGKPVNEWVSRVEQMKRRGMEYEGKEGFDVAGMAGTVLSPASLMTGNIPAATTLAGRIGQGAAIGAGYGATAPVTEGEFWPEKGMQVGTSAAIGAALPPAFDLVKSAGKGAYHLVEPYLPGGTKRIMGRTATQLTGPRTKDVIRELRKNEQLVPGSQPIAGEAAVPAGSTEFAGLQKYVSGYRPSEYADIASSQDAARIAELGKVAGSKSQLKAAEATRAASAEQLYGQAFDKGINLGRNPLTGKFRPKAEIAGIKGEITKLLKRPSIKAAVKEARRKAADEGLRLDPTGSVRGLHYMKRALDDQIGKAEGDDQRILLALRDRLLTTIEGLSPDYGKARQAYREASVPINQMQVGQFLEDKLIPALNEHGGSGSQRAAAYAAALRDAPGTIKKSTGFPRYEDLGQILTPEQLQSTQNVAADLGRRATFEQQAKQGMPAVLRVLGKQEQEFNLPPILHRAATITNAIINRLRGGATERTLMELSKVMQDPQEMAKIMEAATPSQRATLAAAMRNPLLIGAPTAAIREVF